jgi:hypothetical protein
MKRGKATGVDNIPIEFLKNLKEDNLTIFSNLINDIYQQGELPEDFKKSIMIPIPKKQNSQECSNFRTLSIISHASKVLLAIILKRIQEKVERYVGDDQYGFRANRGTKDAIMELNIIAQKRIKDHLPMYVGFVDFEKAFDRVNHTKLLECLKKIGIDGKDLTIIKNIYKDQSAAFRINNELTDWFKIKRGVRQGCICSPSFFNIYSEELITEALEDIKGISINGINYNRIRYADDIAIITENLDDLKKGLENIDKIGAKFGMKINVAKTKLMIINGNENLDYQINLNNNSVEKVNDFRYLGSLTTEDGRSLKEVKTRIGMAKDAFWKNTELLRNNVRLDLKLRMLRCYVWSVFLYGCETWTLTKEIENRINAFDVWCARRILKISWVDKISNEEVWRRIGGNFSLYAEVSKRKWKYAGHLMRGSSGSRLVTALEGWTWREKRQGRPRREWLDDLKDWTMERKYTRLKSMAQDRKLWRNMRANLRIGDRT